MSYSLLADVPAIRAAVAEEAEVRDAAFLGARAELLPGLVVLPLTLRRYLLLCAAGSPWVSHGGEYSPEEVARFVWICSPEYNAEKVGLDSFLARLAKCNYGELLQSIAAYVSNAFFDAPPSGGSGEAVSYYSFAVVYVDLLATEYSWTLDSVLDCPLGVLFQLVKRIRERGGDTLLFNPLSDAAKADYVKSLNATAPAQ